MKKKALRAAGLALAVVLMALPMASAKYVVADTLQAPEVTVVYSRKWTAADGSFAVVAGENDGYYAINLWGACGGYGTAAGGATDVWGQAVNVPSRYGRGGRVRAIVQLGAGTYYLCAGVKAGNGSDNSNGTPGGGYGYGGVSHFGGGGGGYSHLSAGNATPTTGVSSNLVALAGGGGGGAGHPGWPFLNNYTNGGSGGLVTATGETKGGNSGSQGNVNIGPITDPANYHGLVFGAGGGWLHYGHTGTPVLNGGGRVTWDTGTVTYNTPGTPLQGGSWVVAANAPAAGGGGGGYNGGGAGGCCTDSTSYPGAVFVSGGGGGSSYLPAAYRVGTTFSAMLTTNTGLGTFLDGAFTDYTSAASRYDGVCEVIYLGPNPPDTSDWLGNY